MATGVFFHAHPDDEAIATGGTMAKAAAAGHRVVLVLATRGELGEPVDGVLDDGEELWQRRVDETYRSAEILGVARVEFLGYRDSGMMGEPTNDDPACFWQADLAEAADRFAAILREEHADFVVAYDDHGGYGHPDHIQVHRVGVEGAHRAGVPKIYEATINRTAILRNMEAMEAEAPEDMALRRAEIERDEFGSPEEIITHAVDVQDFVAHKRASMTAHASQIPEDSFFLAMSPEVFERAFGTEWYIEHGVTRGRAEPLRMEIF
jgi:LmbE family N-acetylglucosaminyl deacetylase